MFLHISFFCLILCSSNDLYKKEKGIVLLADGTIFYGKSVGVKGTVIGEICFNTGVTGYQSKFLQILHILDKL